MLRKLLRISRGTLCLLTALWLTNPGAVAQEFDPATINWEALSKIPMKDFFIKKFNKDCAVCHGEDLRGAPLGTPLVGMDLRHGDSVEQIANSIATGFPDKGMPAWEETLDADQIWNLALYVAEQRQGTTILDKRDDIPLEIPAQSITSEQYSFRPGPHALLYRAPARRQHPAVRTHAGPAHHQPDR
jgi:cytochrome c553